MTTIFQDDFGSSNYTLKDGQVSPNGKWKCVYTGYGTVGVQPIQSPTNGRSGNCMLLQPQVNNAGTSASLVLTQSGAQFADFDETFYMRTIKQNKSQPNNWETAWHMFRYLDNTHHYYFYIGVNGTIEVGKKDYELVSGGIKTPDGKVYMGGQDQQVFLSTASKVTFTLGKWYKIRLVMKGYNIKIYVDDSLKVDLTDDGKTGNMFGKPVTFGPSAKMGKGASAWYVEDARVEFDNVVINDVSTTVPPVTPPYTEPVATEQVYIATSTVAEQKIFKTEKGCDDYITNHGNVFIKKIASLFP